MKRIFTFFSILVLILEIQAQSPKKVVIEHFTQASCPPCAGTNPIIHPIMERNADKIVRVTHQVSWPGEDPMNKDNSTDVAGRVSYYGINGVPSSRVGGNNLGSPLDAITDDNINSAAAEQTNYELTVNPVLNPNLNEVEINVSIKLTGPLQGNPVLRVAINEKIISWDSPPGTNGEREFHHVMKKYLPNTAGTNIKDLATVGDTKTIKFNYTYKNIYDISTMEVVAFIQDESTKAIAQGASADFPYVKTSGVDGVIRFGSPTSASSTLKLCGTKTSPLINITNTGSEVISSIKFNSKINNGAVSEFVYNTNSPLKYLETRQLVIDNIGIPFVQNVGNNIEIKIIEVNGKPDQGTANNTLNIKFDPSPITTLNSIFEIKSNSKPELVTYSIIDDLGKEILRGGPLTSNTAVRIPLTLEKDRCYAIETVNDYNAFNVTTKIFNDQNVAIYTGRALVQGRILDYVSTSNIVLSTFEDISSKLELSPNPAHSHIDLRYNANSAGEVNVKLMNEAGVSLIAKTFKTSTGDNLLKINVDHIAPGFYLLEMNENSKRAVKKVIIE